MPKRTYIHKSAKEAPGRKTWKDKLTLVLRGNAAGHTIKLKYSVKSREPPPNKNYLPVFWQHSKNAGVTPVLFMEWFHQCFIPEV